VPIGEKADEKAVDKDILPYDDFRHFLSDGIDPDTLFLDLLSQLVGIHVVHRNR